MLIFSHLIHIFASTSTANTNLDSYVAISLANLIENAKNMIKYSVEYIKDTSPTHNPDEQDLNQPDQNNDNQREILGYIDDFINEMPKITFKDEYRQSKDLKKIMKLALLCRQNIIELMIQSKLIPHHADPKAKNELNEIIKFMGFLKENLDILLENVKMAKKQSVKMVYLPREALFALCRFFYESEDVSKYIHVHVFADFETFNTLKLLYQLRIVISRVFKTDLKNCLDCSLEQQDHLNFIENFKSVRNKIGKLFDYENNCEDIKKIIYEKPVEWHKKMSLLSSLNMIFILVGNYLKEISPAGTPEHTGQWNFEVAEKLSQIYECLDENIIKLQKITAKIPLVGTLGRNKITQKFSNYSKNIMLMTLFNRLFLESMTRRHKIPIYFENQDVFHLYFHMNMIQKQVFMAVTELQYICSVFLKTFCSKSVLGEYIETKNKLVEIKNELNKFVNALKPK